MAAESSRVSAFRDYVQQSHYVCTIGSSLARSGRLDVQELPEDAAARTAVTRGALRRLLHGGKGGAMALLYPREPETYEDLQALHGEVHADIFATFAAEDITAAAAEGSLKLPKPDGNVPEFALPLVAAEIRRRHSGRFIVMPGRTLVKEMGLPVDTDPYRSLSKLRAGSAAMLGVAPDTMPGVEGHALQTIVLSPLYQGDVSEEVRAALAALNLPDVEHGRHAPATGMVINFAQEVLDARASQVGQQIRARMHGAMLGRYKAMQVLAQKPDAALRFQALVDILRGAR